MPSLTPLSEGSETLTPLALLVATPEIFTPGLLPSALLFPRGGMVLCSTSTICSASLLVGCDGPYPRDNETTPAIEGVVMAPLPETTSLTLTLLPED